MKYRSDQGCGIYTDYRVRTRILIISFSCLLLLSSLNTLAQSPDSLEKTRLQEFDSSRTRINNNIDNFQNKINSLTNPNLNSILSNHRKRSKAKLDSLGAIHELDSMKHGLTTKIDSLNKLNLPTDKYTAKLDSLKQIDPQRYANLVNSKIHDVEGKLNNPINNIEGKVNDKLNLMRQEGGANANLPGNLDTKDLSLGKDLNVNPDLTKDININKDLTVNTDLNNPIKGITQPKIGEIDQLNGVKDKLGDANQVTDKIQSYQGDVSKIANGDLANTKEIPQTFENKVASVDELKDLQKQSGELDKAKGMIGQGNDPEAMKKMAENEIQKQAVNHFQGQEQVLKTAMDKMSKLKQKYSNVNSLEDLAKRPKNPMNEKPLIERIIPGITLQIVKSNYFMIDVNPVVSYRVTKKFNGGLGWNQRFAFSKWNQYAPDARIFGPRVYGVYSFNRGFSVKAEIEKMNALVPLSPTSSDGTRQWVWSMWIGLKKDYKFMGKVRGNVQMLYNLYDDHDNSPYVDRLNVRMGFELPMKKKVKPVAED